MNPPLAALLSPRATALASILLLVAGALACSEDPPAAAPPLVAIAGEPPVALDVAPTHGGTVVMAGEYPVEVVSHASGELYAYVLDEPPSPDATLSVVVPVEGGVRTVELAWDGAEERWTGRVRGVTIVPGPLVVTIVVGSSRWVGHCATIVVSPAIVVVSPPSPSVIVIEPHGKHRKFRGRGHGHGRGHGGFRVH